MAFLVEDGTGLNLANSYVSVAVFKAYHKDRGNTLTGSPSGGGIEDVLVKATDYMDRRFRNRFIGRRVEIDRVAGTAQRLEWPRIRAFYADGGQVDPDSVPLEIEEACMEYALRALTATLAPDPVTSDRNVAVVKVREKVGPIETETEFAEGGATFKFKEYPEIDAILRGLITPRGRAIH